MSTCVPTPVSTAFSTVTVDTITTTYSFSTSAVPPIITTRVDPYCENEAVLLDSTVCLKTGTKAGTETLQPSSDVVYTISYETAIPVITYVPISTIYGGCSDTPGNNPGVISGGSSPAPSNDLTPGPSNLGSNFNSGNGTNSDPSGNNGGSISVPPGHTLVTSSVLVYTTGPPTTSVIPSVFTLPNGQVTTTSILTVITPKPSQVYVPTTALVEATGGSNPSSGNSGNMGVIIGVVIGGFIGLCLIILAWWYVRRRRKTAYDEILHEHEKQIENQEARRQAVERSKDPTRNQDGDPKPTPYHYGSLLSAGSRIQSSTSTGVTLSQNPFEGGSVGNRATYMAPGSPLFTTVPAMGELGTGPGWGEVAGVGAGTHGIEGRDGARNLMHPSASSVSNTSGSIHTTGSMPTLGSDSGRSTNLDYLRTDSSVDGLTEVDIGGSRVISPPPHLSMSFGSWNTSTSKGQGSVGSRRSSDVDTGTDPSDSGRGSWEEEGRGRLLRPGQHHHQHQQDTMESYTTATLVQTEAPQITIGGHLRKRSGSPVSWASPARGTLFIVNQRDSEDL